MLGTVGSKFASAENGAGNILNPACCANSRSTMCVYTRSYIFAVLAFRHFSSPCYYKSGESISAPAIKLPRPPSVQKIVHA